MGKYHRIKNKVGDLVMAAYYNKCTKCGETENLCIHHIIKMKPTNSDYNDPKNLIVLCNSCHMAHHRKEGDIKPTSGFKKGQIANPNGRRGKNTSPVICKEKDCDKVQHGKGYCKKHYEYRRIHGIL